MLSQLAVLCGSGTSSLYCLINLHGFFYFFIYSCIFPLYTSFICSLITKFFSKMKFPSWSISVLTLQFLATRQKCDDVILLLHSLIQTAIICCFCKNCYFSYSTIFLWKKENANRKFNTFTRFAQIFINGMNKTTPSKQGDSNLLKSGHRAL